MTELEDHLLKQINQQKDYFWHHVRFSAASEIFPKDQPISVLDIGAGAGVFGHLLKENFPQSTYSFVEPLSSLEKYLEETFGQESNKNNAKNYEFSDYIVLLDVLEHQEDDAVFLKDIVGKMSPGSKLIITVPAMPMLWSTWDEKFNHFRRYTKSSLRSSYAHLDVKEHFNSYFFIEMFLPCFFRKL
ncbi:MAG: methyltransferase domain-containing protein [Planctomycetes bacterium]|nr:methyltransferase domain-containing protein [Planctomycetota bacterium]